MMIPILALLTILFSLLLVLGSLREIIADTYNTVALGAERAHAEGVLIQRTAFASLWLMIFLLCYL